MALSLIIFSVRRFFTTIAIIFIIRKKLGFFKLLCNASKNEFLQTNGLSRVSQAPAGIYLLKVKSGDTRTISEIHDKDTRSPCGAFIVNFGQISLIVLVFPLLNLNK